MAGYLVACIQWHDAAAVEAYGAISRESMRPYGGKYLARGSPHAKLEGHAPDRFAIVEFPSAAAAREWAECDAYAPARKIREEHATTHWVVVMDSAP
jgi:uncharacterized protein (DUF1330 family)